MIKYQVWRCKYLKKIKKELQEKLVDWEPELLELVTSVKGLGKRVAAELIIYTQGFKDMNNQKTRGSQIRIFSRHQPKE